jgi:hypothetical protein
VTSLAPIAKAGEGSPIASDAISGNCLDYVAAGSPCHDENQKICQPPLAIGSQPPKKRPVRLAANGRISFVAGSRFRPSRMDQTSPFQKSQKRDLRRWRNAISQRALELVSLLLDEGAKIRKQVS